MVSYIRLWFRLYACQSSKLKKLRSFACNVFVFLVVSLLPLRGKFCFTGKADHFLTGGAQSVSKRIILCILELD